MTYQRFKPNDALEGKVNDVIVPIPQRLSTDLDSFNSGAYQCWKLGEVILATKRSPAVGIVSDADFVKFFHAIHDYFTRPGTFEFYLELFRSIWGESVEVEFNVPAPGKLEIEIAALDLEEFQAQARVFADDVYTRYDLTARQSGTDYDLQFRISQGLKTQSEVDAIMYELQTAGIWVETTLILS